MALLADAAFQAFAASFLDHNCAHLINVEGNDPPWPGPRAHLPSPPASQRPVKEPGLGRGHVRGTPIKMANLFLAHVWRLRKEVSKSKGFHQFKKNLGHDTQHCLDIRSPNEEYQKNKSRNTDP